jgi:TonB family protein
LLRALRRGMNIWTGGAPAMLVKATRTISALLLRALIYLGLFSLVVLLHIAITESLRAQGLGGVFSLTVSGAVILGVVLLAFSAGEWLREQRAVRLEAARVRLRLPGPCCVLWNDDDSGAEDAMQWTMIGPLRARFPPLLQRLEIEGLAIVDFEISAEGRAKNFRCIHAWPIDAVYEAAREGLLRARFEPKPDIHVHHGVSYQLPIVFRLRAPARGVRARPFAIAPESPGDGLAALFAKLAPRRARVH